MTRPLRAPSRIYPFFYLFASVRARHDDRDASGPAAKNGIKSTAQRAVLDERGEEYTAVVPLLCYNVAD